MRNRYLKKTPEVILISDSFDTVKSKNADIILTLDTVVFCVFCDILLGAGVSILRGGRFGGSIFNTLVSYLGQQVLQF